MSPLFEKAQALETTRDYDRAIFYYSLVLFDDPYNYAALYNRGFCKLQQGKAELSKELISDAIKDFENSITVIDKLGVKNLPAVMHHLQIANDELDKISAY